MFNQNKKQLFLSNTNIKENTKYNYARIFEMTQKYEEELNKDISEFSLSELENILYEFEANNRNTLETYARVISGYLNWCTHFGLNKENPLADLKPDDFEKYVLNKEEYITDEQLREIEDNCMNFQDAVILRLIFEGVGGKELSEITNLKKSDVDWDRKSLLLKETLTSDGNNKPLKTLQRHLKVSDYLLTLIKGAIEQKEYFKKNGKIIDNDGRIRDYTDLINNDYVIRPSNTKTITLNEPCDKFVIYRRIVIISETLGVKNLTTKYLQRSGIVHFAKTINKKELSISDLKEIGEKFNIKSYHNLKGFLKIRRERKYE